ncbi:LRR receptor-like serine/threonine-protein kinase RGI5 [Rosa sericea]
MEKNPHALLLLLFLLLLNLSLPSLQQKLDALDLRALVSIKNSLTDVPSRRSRAGFFSTWDFASSDPCSSFSGITCSSLGRVTTLTLGTGLADSPGLAGSLPPAVSDLTELTQLILYPGIVTGPIPTQLGRLVNLRVISLTNNRLTGQIPSTLSLLTNLHTLDLSYNRLTGSVPPGLTRLPMLKVLILSSNDISGGIPSVLSQLLHLDFSRNRLTGHLPQPLPSTLRYVSLAENDLAGPISGFFDSISDLVHLDLSMNRFSGALPASLFRTSLPSLLLQRNNLSGWVPSLVPEDQPSYGEGSIVDLSHNSLTGELSPILASVESLYLNNNRLIGTVPREYVKSVYVGTTRTLYLQHNYLSGFPVEPGSALPDTVSLCLSYNCMVPPVGLASCPASAGTELSRPASQCSVFNYG